MSQRNWSSNLKIAGGVIAILLGFAVPFGITVSELLVSEGGHEIQSRPQKQKHNPEPAPAATPSLTQNQEADYYRPDCTRPQKQEDALYCELRRLAEGTKELVALAGEPNLSGWAQAGAAFAALIVAAIAAIYAGRGATAAHKTVATMQDIARRELRAYVTLHSGSIEWDGFCGSCRKRHVQEFWRDARLQVHDAGSSEGRWRIGHTLQHDPGSHAERAVDHRP